MGQMYYKTSGGTLVPIGSYVINDTSKVSLTGTETISGAKTFSNGLTVSSGNITVSSGSLTMTGDANITGEINLPTSSGSYRGISLGSGTGRRWYIGKSNTAESGSNLGSSFIIWAYDDSGNQTVKPVSIARDTGIVSLPSGLTVSRSDTSEKVIELQQGASATAGHLYSKGAGYLGWIGTRADSTRRFAYESNGGNNSGANFGLFLYDSAGTNVKTVWDANYVNSSSPTNMNITAATTFSNGLTVSSGKTTVAATTASVASLNIAHGTAPTAPSNGDVWTTTTGVYTRVNGETREISNKTGYKNRIINGSFSVRQRDNVTSTTSDLAYVHDRWFLNRTGGTATYSTQTVTLGDLPDNAVNCARLVTASQSAAGDFALLAQTLDGVRTLAGETITISFWAKASSGTPKVAVEWSQNFGTGGSPSAVVNTYAGQVTLSTSWARYSVVVAVPSVAGKTLGTTAATNYAQLSLWTSAGSNWNSRTGTLGIQNTTIEFWGVQVEDNPAASAYEYRPDEVEIALCQRYYYRINSSEGGLFTNFVYTRQHTATLAYGPVPLPVKMRKSQTLEISALSTFTFNEGTGAVTPTGIAIDMANQMSPSISVTYSTGGRTVGNAGTLYANNSSSTYLALNAEII